MKPSSTGGPLDAKLILVFGDCLWVFYEFARIHPIKRSIRYSLAEAFDGVEELKLLYWASVSLKEK